MFDYYTWDELFCGCNPSNIKVKEQDYEKEGREFVEKLLNDFADLLTVPSTTTTTETKTATPKTVLQKPKFKAQVFWSKNDSKDYVISLSAPGVAKEHLKVTFDNASRVLKVAAEMNDSAIIESFKYVWTLSKRFDETKIKVSYTDGIFTIIVPAKEAVEAPKVKEIEFAVE